MVKRKPASALGLAMMDIVSNALAGTVILFICISSLRKPYIPPERMQATLFVRYEIENSDSSLSSEVFLEPIHAESAEAGGNPLYVGPADVAQINKAGHGLFTTTNCGELSTKIEKKRQLLPPCVTVYSPVDSPNVHYLIMRDPPDILWKTGLLYQDYEEIDYKENPVKATIKAWYIFNKKTGDVGNMEYERNMTGPTDTISLEFKAPKYYLEK